MFYTQGHPIERYGPLDSKLKELLKSAASVKMTPEEREAQRRSFVYGNTKIENDQITRQSVDDAADRLSNRGTAE